MKKKSKKSNNLNQKKIIFAVVLGILITVMVMMIFYVYGDDEQASPNAINYAPSKVSFSDIVISGIENFFTPGQVDESWKNN